MVEEELRGSDDYTRVVISRDGSWRVTGMDTQHSTAQSNTVIDRDRGGEICTCILQMYAATDDLPPSSSPP
jgi:hypothetical protein